MTQSRRPDPVRATAVACGALAAAFLGAALVAANGNGIALDDTTTEGGASSTAAAVVAAAAVATAATAHQVLVAAGARRGAAMVGAAPESGGAGREHHFWPFVAGIALFASAAAASAAAALASGGADPSTNASHARPTVTVGLAVGAAAALSVVRLALAVRAAAWERRQGGWFTYRAGWFRYLRGAPSPEGPVTIVDAVAVVVATAVAAVAVGVRAWDPAAPAEPPAAAIAAVAATTAVVLLALVRPLVVGTSASGRDLEIVQAALTADPSVVEVVDLRTRNVGPDDLLVAARVHLDHELTFPEAAAVVARIRRTLRQALPAARAVFVEADVGDEWRPAPVTVDEHEPDHDVPDEVRDRLATPGRGELGYGIPLESEG